VPLARTREEVRETPSLLNPVQDQCEKMKQDFHALGRAEGIAKLRSRKDYLVFRTLTVEEQWEESDKWAVIDRMKEILSQRPYFSVPQMGQEAQKKRIDEFVKSVQRPKEEPKCGGLTPREKGPGSSFGI
jgi:hypothetical protein